VRPVSEPPLLDMRGISKGFPGVIALEAVDLAVARGEIVALCGENGAGKSTLMKILGGVYQPDAGEISLAGQPVRIQNVQHAMRCGIAFIHQELNVLDNLDVAANVFLGREPVKGPFRLIDRKKIHADTEPWLRRLGLQVSSHAKLGELSLAQRQLVEIAKALSLQARILILDEPTSSLTLSETDRLLQLLAEFRQQGVSLIYISHRLGEVDRCADRVIVLRDGKNAGELSRAEISHERMVRLMVGRELKNFYVHSDASKSPGYFQVRNLRTSRYPTKRVSFDAAKGEILGLAGLVGSGRSELAKAIFGLDPLANGKISLAGEALALRSARDAISHGIFLVPEDRRREGLIVGMSVRENISLPSLRRFARAGLVDRKRERQIAQQQISSLNVKTPDAETLVLNLSGGNQQKVVLAKWLSLNPRVMILDEPTRGIDVGAKAEIYRLMRDLAARGNVVLMISSDMEEVLHISDRVAVMHEGEITGVLGRADCSEENIMHLAVGHKVAAAQPAFAA